MVFLLLLGGWFTGCSPSLLLQGGGATSPRSDLRIMTRQGNELRFREGSWSFTPAGIEGTAEIRSALSQRRVDTAISYAEIASADSERDDAWTQLMLTILGVLIVVGLAGIILYAAFRATER